jgi:hypothetical protein
MADHPPELAFFRDREVDQLAQLVLDLAAQLHIERQRRLALETLLTRSGTIAPADVASLATDPDFLAQSRTALDDSQRRLLDILIEHDDRRAPLRDETRSVAAPSPGANDR